VIEMAKITECSKNKGCFRDDERRYLAKRMNTKSKKENP